MLYLHRPCTTFEIDPPWTVAGKDGIIVNKTDLGVDKLD
jgi:hypothetical protein